MLVLERENFVQFWMRQLRALLVGSVSVDFYSSPEDFEQIKQREQLGQNDFNFRIFFPQIKSPCGTIILPILQITFTWSLMQRFIGSKEVQISHQEALNNSLTIFSQIQAIDTAQLTCEHPEIHCIIDEQLRLTVTDGPVACIKPLDNEEMR